jgi:hypothetical protein
MHESGSTIRAGPAAGTCIVRAACARSEQSVRTRRGREGGCASHLRMRTHACTRRKLPSPSRAGREPAVENATLTP